MDVEQQKPDNLQPNGRESGQVFIPLKKILKPPSSLKSECCIYKVHEHLREQNKKAYEPQIIAIGPYHRGNEKLILMEKHKVRYLQILLQGKKENYDRYIEALRQHQEKVRNFYAEALNFSSDELLEMMVLDGCFIIELVRKANMPHLRDPNDPIFKMNWIINSLQRDLMLFENQLPFFVLSELFGMMEHPNDKRFIHLLLNFFTHLEHYCLHGSPKREYTIEKVNHLLDFIHIHMLPRHAEVTSSDQTQQNGGERSFIRCATEMREAGVKFEKSDGESLFDISFRKGRLRIPTIIIEDRTEAFLRNLIAHEQYSESSRVMFVTEYVRFLDCLIDTSKDVEILCRYGIIDNLLGNGEAVCRIFNKITDSVVVHSNYFPYAETEKSINSHCNTRWNWWKAKLRHDYFNSPWAFISFLAVSFLIILSVLQTTFTVFPRH